ncbi:TetR family transcriptional regulator [Phytoactinopolyspora mesophila]|uniref:TetR family transcriptional regulator n=1 Tax=Phytoactinopolyspora mesophila TaxID=2650750 RepID=A0A7K3M918_9ACTN|nr:TetR family transcriptional regulator [Phytoactinopolyspora mesophila]NDL59467.1 TetR family transcriptional regulator [Phytoactinopolyspora mesophila]
MSEAVRAITRQEQKERTRESILASALELSRTLGFAQISIRQVTRHAGLVPAAFYRHFESMEQLGLTLVEQSFATLRRMIRDAQTDPYVLDNIIDESARVLVEAVRQNQAHFGFMSRERVGGSSVVRLAIRHELDLFVSELAVVLARLPNIQNWHSDDVHMVSRLFVRNMVAHAEELAELPPGSPELEERIRDEARREMRLIVIGFRDWRPQRARALPHTS